MADIPSLPPEAAALVAAAESLCGRADDAILAAGPESNAAHEKAYCLGRRALKAFTEAAKLAPTARLRLPILMRAVELAEAQDDDKAIRRLVRQAVACGSVVSFEDLEILEDAWEWACLDGKPFPDLPSGGVVDDGDRRPAVGQTSFLDG